MSGFSNSVLGGMQKLIRRAIQSPNFITGITGWAVRKDGSAEFQNVTLRGTFLGLNYILNNQGWFFYSGTPATGNLVLSVANAAGTDGFTNPYQSGFVRYSGGGYVQMDASAFGGILDFLPGGTSHAVNLPNVQAGSVNPGAANEQEQLQLTSGGSAHDRAFYTMTAQAADGTTAAVHSFVIEATNVLQLNKTQVLAFVIAAFQAGIVISAGGLSVTGGTATDTLNVTGSALLNGGLTVNGETTITPQTMGLKPVLGGADHAVTGPVTGTTNASLSKSWTVNANDSVNGTVSYRLKAGGYGVIGSTAETLRIQLTFLGVNVGSDVIPSTFLPINASFEWTFDGTANVITPGVTGTARSHGTFNVYEIGGAAPVWTAVIGQHTGVADSTVDTTVNHTMGFGASWGAVTGAPTITGAWSTFERIES